MASALYKNVDLWLPFTVVLLVTELRIQCSYRSRFPKTTKEQQASYWQFSVVLRTCSYYN